MSGSCGSVATRVVVGLVREYEGERLVNNEREI